MDLIKYLFDLFLHLDDYLSTVIATYGTWTYILLFGVIFIETGLVVTPFLPGDSLLFAAGSFAALGSLNPVYLFLILGLAAILGDTVNYWIGHAIGPRAFSSNSRFLKKEHLDRTHEFFEKYGGKTIIIARFVPIVRTFAPFVAGIGEMTYWKFITYNIVGGLSWVALFVFAGYFFGNLPVVKHNFEIVILVIIAISLLPAAFEYFKGKAGGKKSAETEA